MKVNVIFTSFAIFGLILPCDGLIPLAIPAAVAVGSAIGSLFYLLKADKECTGIWHNPNITGLYYNLNQMLHGQHLVINPVTSAIRGHVANPNPKKALVLSFHGWTGGGKNFVSQIIAEHLFQEGINSEKVHLLISTHHFPHTSKIELYKDQLRSWIHGNVTKCRNSLFIFDEIDKMMPQLLDVIVPFLDYHTILDNVDFRHSIFLFLSNLGGSDIALKTYEHWKTGQRRDSITLQDMEPVIMGASFNAQDGGLYHASIIQQHLISAYIPFLPLERNHIKQCIVDDIVSKGYSNLIITEELKNDIADQLEYFPPQSKLYSKSGCKRVSQKVDVAMEEQQIFHI